MAPERTEEGPLSWAVGGSDTLHFLTRLSHKTSSYQNRVDFIAKKQNISLALRNIKNKYEQI